MRMPVLDVRNWKRIPSYYASKCATFDRLVFAKEAWSETVWQEELRRSDRTYLMLTEEPLLHQSVGNIVALGGVTHGPEAEILTLSVAEKLRRQGVATSLLMELKRIAQQQQAETIFLEVRSQDVPATQLYREFGFQEVGLRKNYYADDDALIMALALTST